MDLAMLVDYTPLILFLGGFTAISWLVVQLVRPTPVVGESLSWLVKGLSFFGFFIGLLLIMTAWITWSAEASQIDTGTQYLLIITGLALFLKPIRDLRWAALLGLAAGGFCVGLVYLFYPLPETVYTISSTWIYLLIFLIPALFIYLLFKFVEDVVNLIAAVLSFKPILLLLGFISIAQSILLLFNTSLFRLLFS